MTDHNNKCKWLNQKGNSCPWKSLQNKKYCKRHSIYEDLYEPEDIPTLTKCSSCKNLFKLEENLTYKTCIKCRSRSKPMKKQIKEKCIFISKLGSSCRNYKFKYEYCKKHQSFYKWKTMTDNGDRVCTNWIRGCFAKLSDDDISKCKECKNKHNVKYNKRYKNKQSMCKAFNTSNDNINKYICFKCKTIVNDKSKYYNNKCIKCYNQYLQIEENRNKRDIFQQILKNYKGSATRRNITWNLSDKQALYLYKQKCHYCAYNCSVNGIDRINSNGVYDIDNCVSCCKRCNIMKNVYSINDFSQIIIYLTYQMGLHTKWNLIDEKYVHHFKSKKSVVPLQTYIKNYSHKRNIEFNLQENEYHTLLKMPCYYCKNFTEKGCNGIDRIHSYIGYTSDNCVPCCTTCNMLKGDMNINIFKTHILNIFTYFILHKEIIYTTNKDKILKLLVQNKYKINELRNLKLIKTPTYYYNLIFDGNITDINNMKISLEFVTRNDKLKFNIWNFFRRYISSFRVQDKSKLVGRQIYILVKDTITDTYLGILSLSSDYKNISSRDNYIGWTAENRFNQKRLNNILNISTCVSTQPFGFNFNGGKLLTSLCFTKEVLSYIHNKYNCYIQGYTTMSLYGKSIQYSRLPCIKYVGMTNGNSVYNISSDVVKLCKETLTNDFNIDNVKSYSKFEIIMNCFSKLNISKEDYCKSNKKGVYFGYTHKNSCSFLNCTTDIEPDPITTAPTIDDIYLWWRKRWAHQRYKHLQKTQRLKHQDDIISKISSVIGND